MLFLLPYVCRHLIPSFVLCKVTVGHTHDRKNIAYVCMLNVCLFLNVFIFSHSSEIFPSCMTERFHHISCHWHLRKINYIATRQFHICSCFFCIYISFDTTLLYNIRFPFWYYLLGYYRLWYFPICFANSILNFMNIISPQISFHVALFYY